MCFLFPGHVGWGISWYINGLLIPEIHLVRGKTYTFVVEGGNNPDIPAKYHPFYITDDPIGGYEHKRDEEKQVSHTIAEFVTKYLTHIFLGLQAVRIFAGVTRSRAGKVSPIGVGRLCNWTPDIDGPPADDFQSFGAYQRTLTLKCDQGEPGIITWTPDRNTPDTVYYHCFTHRYLGWKIHIHDSCDDVPYAASEKHEVRIPAAGAFEEDIAAESSIRHETKVSPNDNFLLKHQTDLIKNHNMNGTPPKLTFELTKSSEITKLISDGIRAAEALEESILRNKPTAYSGVPANEHYYNKHSNQPYLKQQQTSQISPVASNAILPQKPYISTAAPEILHGETHVHYQNTHSQPSSSHQIHHSHSHHHQHLNNFTNLPAQSQKTIGLSEYLRPPQNAPLFRPVKLPGRRPFPAPIKKTPQIKPVLPQQLHRYPSSPSLQQTSAGALPLPSVIVNHYRKPVPGLLKPFVREQPFPIQPLAASVLLLGQPTQLVNQRMTDVLYHPKPKPVIPVPYGDLIPQDTQHQNTYSFNGNLKIRKDKKPIHPPKLPVAYLPSEKPLKSVSIAPQLATVAVSAPGSVFKKPFDVHEVKEEPLSADIASMKPAINNGFKPDSVVVESGFRPILRQQPDDTVPESIHQIAHRREDPGSEIDEVMETDTLFLTAQKDTQSLNFEPMFIPSPPDSTNATIIRNIINSQPVLAVASPLVAATIEGENPVAVKLRKPTLEELLIDPEVDDKPAAAMLRKPTLEDLLSDPEMDVILENDEITVTENDDKSDAKKQDLEKEKNNYDVDLYAEEIGDIGNSDEKDDEEDKEAQAAERIDTYYLPPDNKKIPQSSLPSGSVITYDGKTVVDTSLVLPPKLEARDTSYLRRQNHGFSKIEELIRNTPQFKPFRGDIPPPISDFIFTERSLKLGINPITAESNVLHSKTIPGFPSSSQISKSTSSASTLSSSISPITTKLQILKKFA